MHKEKSFQVLREERSLITFWNKKCTISSGKYAKAERFIEETRRRSVDSIAKILE